jgi:hypothetical protein
MLIPNANTSLVMLRLAGNNQWDELPIIAWDMEDIEDPQPITVEGRVCDSVDEASMIYNRTQEDGYIPGFMSILSRRACVAELRDRLLRKNKV